VDLCQQNRNDKNIIVFVGNKCDVPDLREIDQSSIE